MDKHWISLKYCFLFLFPTTLYASFIESTLGTAVVNDATAAYYNPASLTALKNSQFITLGSIANFQSHFSGTVTQTASVYSETGDSHSRSQYYLPSFYLGIPATNKITFGLALVSNFFNRNLEDHAILRYAQSSNRIEDIDLVPAIGFKLNEFFSVGVGIALSQANFLLKPLSGIPALNIPDSQSKNESKAEGLGGSLGILFKPSLSTTMGFSYRNAVTYKMKGSSIFEGNPELISYNYSFHYWTPARSIFSINQMVTPSLGFISTVQYIQWSIINEMNVHGIATASGIVNSKVLFHLRDTFYFTLGSHYRLSPKWIIRVAANYSPSAGNPYYQLTNGDSVTLGSSMGYEISKNITIDASYAQAFIQDQDIHIINNRNRIEGQNKGNRAGFSLKLTINNFL